MAIKTKIENLTIIKLKLEANIAFTKYLDLKHTKKEYAQIIQEFKDKYLEYILKYE